MPFSQFRRIEWGLVAVVVLFITLSWMSYRAYADSERWVGQTIIIRRDLILLGRDVQQAQRGQRGFLLTARSEYLVPYRTAVREFGPRLERLKLEADGNPVQRDRLNKFAPLATDLFAELADTIEKTRRGHKDEAFEVVATDRGERTIRLILAEIDDCTAEEDRLLLERSGRAEWLFRASLMMMFVTGIAATFTAIYVYRVFYRTAR